MASLIDTYGNEFEVPDFTIKDIRDAIPKHCFERSALRSMLIRLPGHGLPSLQPSTCSTTS